MRRAGAIRRLMMVMIVIVVVTLTGNPGSAAEYALLDLRFALARAWGGDNLPAPVVLITVTEESERRLGTVYGPEWRKWYPGLLEKLAASNARCVVWDATFVGSQGSLDRDLAAACSLIPVLAAESDSDRNTAVIRDELAGIGSKQLATVSGVPRRTVSSGDLLPLGAVSAAVFSGRTRTNPRWIDFSPNFDRIPVFGLEDLVEASDTRLADDRRTPLSVFSGAVVFIGTDLPGRDRYPIPGFSQARAPGVYAQIASFFSYLSEAPIRRPNGLWGRAFASVLGALAVILGSSPSRLVRRWGFPLLWGFSVFLPWALFVGSRVWIPQFVLFVSILAATALVVVDRQLRLSKGYRGSLGFDPHLLERYSEEIGDSRGAVERQVAVLCADVREYTRFVTDNPPDGVQEVMVSYMAQMEEIVHRHGGYVNKYVGDEILAVFGFPLEENRASSRAMAAAREMLESLASMNEHWESQGLPTLEGLGIGLDAGPVRFTQLGGGRRVQFDIIGSCVNGASRFQSLTKVYGTPLIVADLVAVDQKTYEVADPSGAGAKLVPLGDVAVRGQGRRWLFALES